MTVKDILHLFVDECWEGFEKKHTLVSEVTTPGSVPTPTASPKPYAEEDQIDTNVVTMEGEVEETKPSHIRAVRTPLSGDKVYLTNDEDMTKKWVRTPEMLKEAGFTFGDVQKIEDLELAKYKLAL